MAACQFKIFSPYKYYEYLRLVFPKVKRNPEFPKKINFNVL